LRNKQKVTKCNKNYLEETPQTSNFALSKHFPVHFTFEKWNKVEREKVAD